MCASVCARVCVGVHRCTCVCGEFAGLRGGVGVLGCVRVYAGVCESARVCSGVRRYEQVYAGVCRCLQVCMENCGIHFYYISKYVFAGVQEHARVCSVCTGVHVPGKFYYNMCLINHVEQQQQ